MIFIDSSVLIAYGIKEDINHKRAEELVGKIAAGKFGSAVTSDYIFDETVTAIFTMSKSKDKAILAGNIIKESMETLKVDEGIFEDSWKMFKSQKASRFSFTDCTSIAVINAKNVEDLASFDKEFEKTGINVIY
jgi:predicted nucleic acid-binding protein